MNQPGCRRPGRRGGAPARPFGAAAAHVPTGKRGLPVAIREMNEASLASSLGVANEKGTLVAIAFCYSLAPTQNAGALWPGQRPVAMRCRATRAATDISNWKHLVRIADDYF